MAIELIRDLLKLEQVVGSDVSQALVEGEITVPETKAAVARVLDVNGDVIVSSREVIQDRVMVEGIIRYSILYVAEEGDELETLDSDIGFTHYIEVEGAKPKMSSHVKLGIEHMEHELLSGRMISVKSVLNVDGQVSQVFEVEAIKRFEGVNDVEVLYDQICGRCSAGSGSSQTVVRENIPLQDHMPTIKKIIHKDVRAKVTEQRAADNRVIVQGNLLVKLLYLCEDDMEPVQYLEDTIPFSHLVEIPDTYQGMESEVDVSIVDVYAEPRENINDELRIVDLEVIMDLDAEVFELVDDTILVDAYSPAVPLEIRKRKVELEQIAGEGQEQLAVKESLSLPSEVPQAKKVLYAYSNPAVTDNRIEEGKVVVEGFLEVHLVYLTREGDGDIASYKEDIPFKQVIDMEGINSRMDLTCDVVEDNTAFTLIAPDEVEVKAIVSTRVKVTEKIFKEVIVGADEKEISEDDRTGIFIYFVKNDDTLWSIAKRYNTTIANIRKVNDLTDDDSVEPGTKLLIYKKLNARVV